MYKKIKVESVAEYIARGGKINKIPTVNSKVESSMHVSNTGPAAIMTLEEASLFYGESKVSKQKRKTTTSRIDLNALPKPLRDKLLSKLEIDPDFDEESEEYEQDEEDELEDELEDE
jgi:hypothetical protein